jgi:hypothetical protein
MHINAGKCVKFAIASVWEVFSTRLFILTNSCNSKRTGKLLLPQSRVWLFLGRRGPEILIRYMLYPWNDKTTIGYLPGWNAAMRVLKVFVTCSKLNLGQDPPAYGHVLGERTHTEYCARKEISGIEWLAGMWKWWGMWKKIGEGGSPLCLGKEAVKQILLGSS